MEQSFVALSRFFEQQFRMPLRAQSSILFSTRQRPSALPALRQARMAMSSALAAPGKARASISSALAAPGLQGTPERSFRALWRHRGSISKGRRQGKPGQPFQAVCRHRRQGRPEQPLRAFWQHWAKPERLFRAPSGSSSVNTNIFEARKIGSLARLRKTPPGPEHLHGFLKIDMH